MIYRVLIADDEIMVRAWLKKCVDWGKYGFQVAAEASNGVEALKCLEKEHIDLILTDIRMPVMDGIAMLKRVRSFDKRVRVLILTCLDDFTLVKSALELDVSNYILKLTSEPTEIEAEILKIKNHFEQESTEGAPEHASEEQPAADGAAEMDFHINPRVKAAFEYLDAHFLENIDLGHVASMVGVTPNYLGKMFMKVYGASFTEELNRRRIIEAKRKLSDPAVRINEVAQSVGFVSPAYFFRVFKKYENCTPTEYRMNTKGNNV